MIREYKTVEEINGPLMMVRMVAWETGSDRSPPGGDTAPTAVRLPLRSSEPMHSTLPARS